jgi:hypothetical protein
MLARLMIDEIKDMNKPELVLERLNRPPQGLADMFNRVVARLVNTAGFDKEDLNEILTWVACSKRDLCLGEVDLVLRLRDLKQNSVIWLEEELKTRFGSFFNVVNAAHGSTDNEGAELKASEVLDAPGPIPADGIRATNESNNDLEVLNDGQSSESNGSEFDNGDFDDTVPSNFHTAVVRFSHASVGQHFRSEVINEGIGIDLNLARARILKTCLLFLTDNIPKKNQNPWRSPNLLGYSADHFLDHLVEVNLSMLRVSSPEESEAISHEIFTLFRSRAALGRRWSSVSQEAKLILQLFGETTVTSLIQEWLPEPSTSPTFKRAELRWLRNAKASFQALLKDFALSILDAWLVTRSPRIDEISAVIYLYAYTSLVSTYVLSLCFHKPEPDSKLGIMSSQNSC